MHGTVGFVRRVQLLSEAPRRVAANRGVRVAGRQVPHDCGSALASVIRVGLLLADVPDRMTDAGEIDEQDLLIGCVQVCLWS